MYLSDYSRGSMMSYQSGRVRSGLISFFYWDRAKGSIEGLKCSKVVRWINCR